MPIKKQAEKMKRKVAPRRAVAAKTVRAMDKQKTDKPKMVSFGRAVSNFFRKYFEFNGVSTRAEYWWTILFVVVTGFILVPSAFALQSVNLLLAGIVALVWILFGVIVIVPLWTLMARRLHDAGFSAKWLWISFAFFLYSILIPEVIDNIVIVDRISFVWGVIILILFLFPSKTKNNPYRD